MKLLKRWTPLRRWDGMQPAQERILWADTAKALAVLSVVVFHNSWGGRTEPERMFSEFCSAFRVPLFFFLAGALSSRSLRETVLSHILRRSAQLLVPFYAFSFLAFAAYLPSLQATPAVFSGILFCIRSGLGCEPIRTGALWFLPCLFVADTVFFALMRGLRRPSWQIAAVAVLACAGWLWGRTSVGIPFHADTALVALTFMLPGRMLRPQLDRCAAYAADQRGPVLVAGAVLFAAALAAAVGNGFVQMNAGNYGFFPLFVAAGVLGSAALALIAMALPAVPVLAATGRMTLAILIFHIPSRDLLELTGLFPGAGNALLADIALAATQCALSIAAGSAVLRVVPQLLGARPAQAARRRPAKVAESLSCQIA